jgi:hypothetical protein
VPSRFLYELTGQAQNAAEVMQKLSEAKKRADQLDRTRNGPPPKFAQKQGTSKK